MVERTCSATWISLLSIQTT